MEPQKEVINKIKNLQELVTTSYSSTSKDENYHFWSQLTSRMLKFFENITQMETKCRENLPNIIQSLSRSQEMWKNSVCSISKKEILKSEANLTADYIASRNVNETKRKPWPIEFWQFTKPNKNKKNNVIFNQAQDSLFWFRMFGFRRPIKFEDLTTALHFHINVIERQHIDVTQSVFNAMIKSTLNIEKNGRVSDDAWIKFIARFGPNLSKLYQHLKGVTIPKNGALSPWISLSSNENTLEATSHTASKEKDQDMKIDEGDAYEMKNSADNVKKILFFHPAPKSDGTIASLSIESDTKKITIQLSSNGYALAGSKDIHEHLLRNLLLDLKSIPQETNNILQKENYLWHTNGSDLSNLSALIKKSKELELSNQDVNPYQIYQDSDDIAPSNQIANPYSTINSDEKILSNSNPYDLYNPIDTQKENKISNRDDDKKIGNLNPYNSSNGYQNETKAERKGNSNPYDFYNPNLESKIPTSNMDGRSFNLFESHQGQDTVVIHNVEKKRPIANSEENVSITINPGRMSEGTVDDNGLEEKKKFPIYQKPPWYVIISYSVQKGYDQVQIEEGEKDEKWDEVTVGASSVLFKSRNFGTDWEIEEKRGMWTGQIQRYSKKNLPKEDCDSWGMHLDKIRRTICQSEKRSKFLSNMVSCRVLLLVEKTIESTIKKSSQLASIWASQVALIAYGQCKKSAENSKCEAKKVMDNIMGDFRNYWKSRMKAKLAAQNDGGIVGKNDWNREFQEALNQETSIMKNGKCIDNTDRDRQLSKISRNFTAIANSYGELIILESTLQDDVRAIKSEKTFGGTAGGKKLLTRSMLFKFCEDPKKYGSFIYGLKNPDYEIAAKTVGHELKGAINVLSASVTSQNRAKSESREQLQITTAMMITLDYMGLRLTAMPFLPLDEILYGSDDCMKTVHCHEGFDNSMEDIAKVIHLSKHRIGRTEKFLYTAGDVEGHVGTDKKYYMIDTARMFPPECFFSRKDLDQRGNVALYRLFRAEFLQYIKRQNPPMPALNADCWTFWSDFNQKDQHTNRKATEILLGAQDGIVWEISSALEREIEEFEISTLHKYGLNVRHIGLLRRVLKGKTAGEVDESIYLQVLVRTIKSDVRSEIRKRCAVGYLIYTIEDLIKDFFNNMTDVRNESHKAYLFKCELLGGALWRFGNSAVTKEESTSLSEDSLVDHLTNRNLLDKTITTLSKMATFRLTTDCQSEDFKGYDFSVNDIQISARVKSFDTMNLSLGNIFNADAAKKLLAIRKKARNSNSENAVSSEDKNCSRLFELSKRFYDRVILVSPLSEGIFFKAAMAQINQHESIKAYVESCEFIRDRVRYQATYKKELKEKLQEILRNRVNWICKISEIRYLMEISPSIEGYINQTRAQSSADADDPTSIIKYIEKVNKDVRFEHHVDQLQPEELDFLLKIEPEKEKIEVKGEIEVAGEIKPVAARVSRILGFYLLDCTRIKTVTVANNGEMYPQDFLKTCREFKATEVNGEMRCLVLSSFIVKENLLQAGGLNQITLDGEISDDVIHASKFLANAFLGLANLELFNSLKVSDLRGDPNVVELGLTGRELLDISAIVIAAYLETNSHLTRLELENNKIKNVGAKAFGETLRKNTHLRIINIHKRIHVSEFHAKKKRRLPWYNKDYNDQDLLIIGCLLLNNTQLTYVDLSRNKIADTGAKAISKALESNATIVRLELYRNHISDVGIRDIALSLKENAVLSFLDLSSNRMHDAGAEKIGELLSSNSALQTVYLAGNNIADVGAKAIGKALKINTSVTSLWLRNNKIKDNGMNEIKKGLKVNSNIIVIDLRWNEIGEDLRKEFNQMLQGDGERHASLKTLTGYADYEL